MREKAIILFVFFAMMLLQMPCNATDIKNEVEKLQQRTLIVVVETAGKNSSAKLSSDEQFTYKKALDSYNQKTKEIIERHWSFNNNIQYKTWGEVKEIPENMQGMYLILFVCRQSSDIKYADFLDYGLYYYPKIFTDNGSRQYIDFVAMYKLSKLENLKKGAIVTRTITNIWPLREDVLFTVQYIQCLLNESIRLNVQADNFIVAKEHHHTLKESTLLIKDSMLIRNRITPRDVKKIYPYHSKVATYDSIYQYIFNNQDVVYVQITPQLISTGEAYRLGFEHVLMNAKTGMIVSYVRIRTSTLHSTSGHLSPNKYISVSVFDQYSNIKEYKEEDLLYGPKDIIEFYTPY